MPSGRFPRATNRVTASRNCLVHSPGKTVALVGVEDLIIVETDDALLVCKRGRSQEVRKVVERLETEHRHERL